MQVLGFDDPIKISKRVLFESTEARPPRAARSQIVRPILNADAPLRCAEAAHIGGIEFEAHIPLSQSALVRLHDDD